MDSLISVIVPVYKVEEYLDECILSLIGQTYRNLEIILVDDGSPDKCPVMCDDWAKKDSRIRVVHKLNGGLSSARNAGIENARGDYLSFVDSDDFFDSRMYEKLYEGISRSPNIGIAGIKFWAYKDGKSEIYNPFWDTKKDVLVKAKDFGILTLKQEICHAATNKLYRRDVIGNVRFREGKLNEDVLFSFDLSKNVKALGVDMWDLNYYAYYYRMRSDSICHSDVPVVIPYIENLQTILVESKDEDYKSTVSNILNKTVYDYFIRILITKSERCAYLRDTFFDFFYEKIKVMRYEDIHNEGNRSITSKLSFFVLQHFPGLYGFIKRRW